MNTSQPTTQPEVQSTPNGTRYTIVPMTEDEVTHDRAVRRESYRRGGVY